MEIRVQLQQRLIQFQYQHDFASGDFSHATLPGWCISRRYSMVIRTIASGISPAPCGRRGS